MRRRSFLKAASAALFVPSFYLAKPQLTTAIDLSDFVADYTTRRYDMSRPFRQGELTYATDARICIRTTLGVSDLADSEARIPPAAGLPWECGEKWKPWPKRRLVPSAAYWPAMCPQCEGKARVGDNVVKCTTCDGEGGDFFVDEQWGSHCDKCSGAGYLGGDWCDYCRGRGDVGKDVPALQVIGDLFIGPQYDRKIRKLQNVEWQPGLKSQNGSSAIQSIRFRCEGAEGMLMPIIND